MRPSRFGLCLVLGLLLHPAIRLCSAATFTCGTSDVACLIASITTANRTPEPVTIRLAAGRYLLTAVDNTTNGANGLPSITSALTIQGTGAETTVIERAVSAPFFRLIQVAASGLLRLEGLTLRGGSAPFGGGIVNLGTLTLTDSTIANNQGVAEGGGIANSGRLTLTDSTVANNGTATAGGGVANFAGGTVTIRHSTFASNASEGGGGIFNAAGGTVTIHDSLIAENSAALENAGGGLSNFGTMSITNTTITGNLALGTGSGFGGGIANFSGTLTLTNSTVAGNATGNFSGRGGGILAFGGTVALQNTILARNTVPPMGPFSQGPDCFGPVTSLGNNLIGDSTGCTITLQPSDLTGDPGLDAYMDNGRPGNGHVPLLPTSQAIDAGNDAVCPAQDQLGEQRVGPCDIGAVEFQSPDRQPPALALTLNQAAFRSGETLRMALHLRNPGPILTTDAYVGVIFPDGQTVLWLTNTAPLEGVTTRLDGNPSTFRPMLGNASWPAGLDVTQENYLTYTFTGGEAPGTYHLLVGWTTPGSLADGRIDEGDVLALDWKAIQFTGQASTLAATAQVSRGGINR